MTSIVLSGWLFVGRPGKLRTDVASGRTGRPEAQGDLQKLGIPPVLNLSPPRSDAWRSSRFEGLLVEI